MAHGYLPQAISPKQVAQDRNRTCTGVTPLGPEPVLHMLAKGWFCIDLRSNCRSHRTLQRECRTPAMLLKLGLDCQLCPQFAPKRILSLSTRGPYCRPPQLLGKQLQFAPQALQCGFEILEL